MCRQDASKVGNFCVASIINIRAYLFKSQNLILRVICKTSSTSLPRANLAIIKALGDLDIDNPLNSTFN